MSGRLLVGLLGGVFFSVAAWPLNATHYILAVIGVLLIVASGGGREKPATPREKAQRLADLIYDDLLPHRAGRPMPHHVDAIQKAMTEVED